MSSKKVSSQPTSASKSGGKDNKDNKDKKGQQSSTSSSSSSSSSSSKDVKKGVSNKDDSSTKTRKDGSTPQQQVPAEPPKPRWTGKLPVQYLNEYCQKNQMNRPVFEEMKVYFKGQQQFKFKVTLAFEGKKKQITYKTYQPPHSSQSVMDAKAYAALVALHDLCGNTTIYKLFPPEYTPFWLSLAEVAKQEQEQLQKEMEQQLLEETKRKEREPKHTQQIPSITMSDEAIRTIHSLTKQMNLRLEGGDLPEESASMTGEELNKREKDIVGKSLEELGFKQQDIDNAFQRVKDITNLTNLISWLCLNVTDDSLPVAFRPKNLGIQKKSKPSLSSSSSTNNTHIIIARDTLLEMGWLVNEIDSIIDSSLEQSKDDQDALTRCWYRLVGLKDESSPTSEDDQSSIQEQRDMEIEALRSIYGDSINVVSKHCYHINLAEVGVLEVFIPSWCKYPFQPPVLILKPLPRSKWSKKGSYAICKEMIKQCQDFIGSPVLFNIVNWCTTTDLAQIIADSKNDTTIQSENTIKIDNNILLGSSPSASTTSSSKKSSTQPQRQTLGSIKNDDRINQELLQLYNSSRLNNSYEPVKKIRESLPVYSKKQQFVELLERNQIVVVTGETGSGKSTQIPQYILESFVNSGKGSTCNIICTQPRRISAIGVADRVAFEWSGGQKNQVGQQVGYQIRNESKRSKNTRLLFCTTGILLRMMVGGERGDMLSGVSHIIVDEVHERSVDNDFLLIILRALAKKRRDLKIILMSATLDAELIANYFSIKKDSIFAVAGFTHPVSHIYLEDSIKMIDYRPSVYLKKQKVDVGEIDDDGTSTTSTTSQSDSVQEILYHMDANMKQKRINIEYIEKLLIHLTRQELGKQKSILVFVPGMGDILNICDRLNNSSMSNSMWVLPLHSSLTPKDQQKVFERAPADRVKIVIATNIAETSITIDDVSIVVDTGRANQINYNPITKNSMMGESFVSKAAIRQRAGRAGRTSAGTCYHLYTRAMESQFDDQETPEILRTPLQQLCLHVKLFQTDMNSVGGGKINKIESFLSNAIQPPSLESIKAAIEELEAVNAIQVEKDGERLTPLGYHLAQLPVDIYIGKMLLFGCIFRCIDPILTIAATLSYKTPFISGAEKRDKPQIKYGHGLQSDHFTFAIAYDHWRRAIKDGNEFSYCRENGLALSTLKTIQDLKIQFAEILSEIGFLPFGITQKSIQKEQKFNKGSDGIVESIGALFNSNSGDQKILKAVLCAGMYPKIGRIDLPPTTYTNTAGGAVANKHDPMNLKILSKRKATEQELKEMHQHYLEGHTYSNNSKSQEKFKEGYKKERIFIHPRSINSDEGEYSSPFLIYHDKVQTSRLFAHHTTNISPMTLLMFSIGGKIEIDSSFQHIILDQWLKFKATGKVLVMIKEIRLMLDKLLELKIKDPSFDTSTSVVIDIITKIVKKEGYL